jgi:hypothetical protein
MFSNRFRHPAADIKVTAEKQRFVAQFDSEAGEFSSYSLCFVL